MYQSQKPISFNQVPSTRIMRFLCKNQNVDLFILKRTVHLIIFTLSPYRQIYTGNQIINWRLTGGPWMEQATFNGFGLQWYHMFILQAGFSGLGDWQLRTMSGKALSLKYYHYSLPLQVLFSVCVFYKIQITTPFWLTNFSLNV